MNGDAPPECSQDGPDENRAELLYRQTEKGISSIQEYTSLNLLITFRILQMRKVKFKKVE